MPSYPHNATLIDRGSDGFVVQRDGEPRTSVYFGPSTLAHRKGGSTFLRLVKNIRQPTRVWGDRTRCHLIDCPATR